jgi:hypothetical protein
MSTFFFNREVDKGELRRLVAWHLTNHGRTNTLTMIDRLKTLGFHHATKAGLSLGLEDLKIPPAKQLLVAYAENEVWQADDRFSRGKITAVERSQKILDVWNAASELLKDEVVDHFRETDLLNPVYMMAFSGARGNLSQVRQLVGMRGLMADPQGEIIDLPIKSNFREGLTVTEYIISCYGARKGLVDTALKTANSGYLTRRLVDVAQAVIIKEVDCGTLQGIFLSSLVEQEKVLLPLKKRLIGRVLARPVRNKRIFLASRNEDICPELATQIIQFKQPKIYVRSPLTCQTVRHVCKLCYGWSLAHGSMVDLGEAVGIIAAQSIGEPGTQLTMRTFHTGGVFSTDVADRIYAPHHGILIYDSYESEKTRTPYGQEAIFFKKAIDLIVKKDDQNQTCLSVPAYTLIYIKPDSKIYWKQVIAEVSDLKTILSGPRKNLGVRAMKEVCSAISGQVYFHQVTTVIFRSDSDVEEQKSSKGKTILFVGTKRQAAPEETVKETVYVQGNAYIHVLEGDVVPSSSLQLPLSKKGDIQLEDKNKHDEFVKPDSSAYIVSRRPSSLGFYFHKKGSFASHWICGSPKEPLTHIFNGNQVLPLCSVYQHYVGPLLTCQVEKQSFLTTSSQLEGIKKSVSYDLIHKFYETSKNEKKRETRYCFQKPSVFTMDVNLATWFYLPKKENIPQSWKKLKKLFINNFSLTQPFGTILDGIQFSGPVFLEWKVFPLSEKGHVVFGVVFRKQVSSSEFTLSAKMGEKSSVAFCALPGTPFTRKTSLGDQQSLFQENLPLTSPTSQPDKSVTSQLYENSFRQEIEIKNSSQQKYCLFQSEQNQMKYRLNGEKAKVKIASFVCRGDQLAKGIRATNSGIVHQITKNEIILRKANPYRASNKSLLSVTHGNLIYEGATLFHLIYQKAKTEDIVQGLPKIEELLEARRTKDLQPIPNNSHDKLKELFENYKPLWGPEIAARISLKEIQQFLVDGVQKVYQSQGVDISDKHIEIIVKQMTSRVFIVHGGQTPLLYGDLVELHQLNKMNEDAVASGRQRATYEPIILGITKASLTTESFLSAASFQETTRVLTQAAIQGRLDMFRGLKENVLIGKLIPAGTGFLSMSS